MDETPHLQLPYLLAAQAQKHVTHNEALDRLDGLVHLAVLRNDLTTPPGAPLPGDRYIVASGGSGAWAGKDDQIALFIDDKWVFLAPATGWICWDEAAMSLRVWAGSSWTTGLPNDESQERLGINALPDVTNKLTVAASATLFNHDGANHQFKVNKAVSSDTASILLQSGFATHAEIGLVADNDLRVKVSADGVTFKDAILIDGSTGAVNFPNGGSSGSACNAVINSAMRIAQRGTSFNDANGYTLDRMFAQRTAGASGLTVSQQTSAPVGGANSLRMQRVSGNNGVEDMELFYAAESADSQRFAGCYAVLSFWARKGASFSAAGDQMTAAILTGTGTDQAPTALVVEKSASVPLTSIWQRFTLVTDAALATTTSQVGFQLSVTPTGTAGANDWFEVTNIQLEPDQVAAPFFTMAKSDDLARCQRYFSKTFPLGTVPAEGLALAGAISTGTVPASSPAGTASVTWQFPVSMRAHPTISSYSPLISGAGFRDSIGGQVAATMDFISESRCTAYNGEASPTSAVRLDIHLTANAEL